MTVSDPRRRADKHGDAVAAKQAAWDRATERRADAEYALELFKERNDLSEEEKAEFEQRCIWMQAAIDIARQAEKEAERFWRQARNRAEREIVRKERRLR